MKLGKIFFTGCVFILLIGFSSCSKGDDPIDPLLSISVDELTFPKGSGTKMIDITSNVDWSLTSSETWCTASPSSGNSSSPPVSITVEENTTTDSRIATLEIIAGDLSKEITVTQAASDLLILQQTSCDISAEGRDINVDLQTSGNYEITIDGDWIVKKELKSVIDKTETFVVQANSSTLDRSGIITFTLNDITEKFKINQAGAEAIPADKTGMESDAVTLASKLYMGWNLGNSLEATGSETAWGNPKTTQELIDFIKASGFNAIRLPCAWDSHLEDKTTCKIKDSWLARVKEVIDYCINDDLYVILNIHWDGGWLEENCTTAKQQENNTKQKVLWEQIATYLRDYDEHLLFAGTNEPNVCNTTEMSVLLSYEQTFIDAVRLTGGRNAYRILIFQGPSTDIEKTNTLMKTLPTDNVPDRLMAEVHYYTPWQFCGLAEDASWGKMFYYWGTGYHSTTDPDRNATWGEESVVDEYFALMKDKFVDENIPVILGEFGAMRRSNFTGDTLTNHLASRAYYFKYVTQQAKTFGIVPFYWDNGVTEANGCALFDRDAHTIFDSQALNALIEGASRGKYPY